MLHFNFFHLYLYYELEKGIVYNTVKIEFLKKLCFNDKQT